MAQTTFSPQTLRGLLITLLVIVVAAGAGLFYLGIEEVRKYSIEVNHSVADAEASGNQVKELQTLRAQLAQSEELVAKANKMFATPDNYQTQAISDIRNHANAAGVTITKTEFDDETNPSVKSLSVSLKAPVSYTKLIHFLDGIESNIPKMQVSSINLSHVDGGGSDSVAVDNIKITIATR